MSQTATQRSIAEYLIQKDRMIIDPAEMMPLFAMGTPAGHETAWLEAVAEVLGDAVELRLSKLPGAKAKLVVKDRAILFNYTQDRTLEMMAQERRSTQNA